MIQEREVREQIAAVLRNEISAENFARWIMSNSWNMHKDSSDEAVDLVSNVHALLAERDADIDSEQAFLAGLSSLLNNVVASLRFDINIRVSQYRRDEVSAADLVQVNPWPPLVVVLPSPA